MTGNLGPLENSIIVTPRLIDIVQVFNGARLTLEQIDKINKGSWILLIGKVGSQNFTQSIGESGQSTVTLDQVLVNTLNSEHFTLTINESPQDPALYSSESQELNSGLLDLVNIPRMIQVKNLNAFQEVISEAAKHSQDIAWIVNLEDNKLELLSTCCAHLEKKSMQQIGDNIANISSVTSSHRAKWPPPSTGG